MLKRIFSLSFSMLLAAVVAVAANKKFTLVVDAGHGGRDAGAVGAISKEKNINLAVALAFGRYVENNCPDVKVVYTRKTDKFVELMARAAVANKAKADLFVSIHTNAVAKGASVKGFETYTLGMHRAADNLEVAKRENAVITLEQDYQSKYLGFDPNSSESYIIFEYLQDKNMENSVHLAKSIQKNVCASASRKDKGVHQAGFLVLRETSMPSCLVELGFISNKEEERQLNDASVQDRMARGLYKAFAEYLTKYSKLKAGSLSPVKATSQPTKTQETVVVAADEKKEDKNAAPYLAAATVGAAATAGAAAADTKKDVAFVPAAVIATGAAAEAEKDVAFVPETKTAAARNDKIAAKDNATAKSAATEPAGGGQKTAEEKLPADKAQPAEAKPAEAAGDAPVFKVQILSGNNRLPAGSPSFKGLSGVDSYQENGLYKYTYGASTNYNEVNALRKSIASKFPGAFVVAFRNGTKVDVHEAMREWQKSRGK